MNRHQKRVVSDMIANEATHYGWDVREECSSVTLSRLGRVVVILLDLDADYTEYDDVDAYRLATDDGENTTTPSFRTTFSIMDPERVTVTVGRSITPLDEFVRALLSDTVRRTRILSIWMRRCDECILLHFVWDDPDDGEHHLALNHPWRNERMRRFVMNHSVTDNIETARTKIISRDDHRYTAFRCPYCGAIQYEESVQKPREKHSENIDIPYETDDALSQWRIVTEQQRDLMYDVSNELASIDRHVL